MTQHFDGFRDQISTWAFDQGKECRMNRVDKIRFEHRHARNHQRRYMRSSSRSFILEEFLSLEKFKHNVQISHGWTDDFYHVGSMWEYRSISEGRLIARAIATQSGRQTCSFTAVDTLRTSILTLRVHEGKPRALPHKLSLGRAHDAIFWSIRY